MSRFPSSLRLGGCARLLLTWTFCLASYAHGWAGEHGKSNVPPTLEIEVLDPNADPLGRPAVELKRDECGKLVVDIPPAVIVHRFYYTGDRSFQAQLLPGGPCIVVLNHPKTGERCYLDVQMLPGAPRVTYSGHGIEYDYGDRGISIVFGLFGNPSVKYRNGTTWSTKLAKAVHAEGVKKHVAHIKNGIEHGASTGGDIVKATAIETHEVAKMAALPLQNMAKMLPFGAAILDPDRAQLRDEKLAQYKRERELGEATVRKLRDEQTYRTNR